MGVLTWATSPRTTKRKARTPSDPVDPSTVKEVGPWRKTDRRTTKKKTGRNRRERAALSPVKEVLGNNEPCDIKLVDSATTFGQKPRPRRPSIKEEEPSERTRRRARKQGKNIKRTADDSAEQKEALDTAKDPRLVADSKGIARRTVRKTEPNNKPKRANRTEVGRKTI